MIARPPRLNGPTRLLARRARRRWRCGRSLRRSGPSRSSRRSSTATAWSSTCVLAGVLLVLVRDDRVARCGSSARSPRPCSAWPRSRSCGCSAATPRRPVRRRAGSTGRSATSTARRASICSASGPCLALAEQRRWPLVGGLGARRRDACSAACCCSRSRAASRSPRSCPAIVVLASCRAGCGAPGRSCCSRRRLALARADAARRLRAGPARRSCRRDVVHARRAAALLAGLGVGLRLGLAGLAAAARAERAATAARPSRSACSSPARSRCSASRSLEQERIARTVDEQYTAFVRLGDRAAGLVAPRSPPTSRLASGAGTRYDYWRIAWGASATARCSGVGRGQLRPAVLRAARDDGGRPPAAQHRAAGAERARARRRRCCWPRARRARAGAPGARRAPRASSPTGALPRGRRRRRRRRAGLVHTSVDWIHLLPGVTGLALAFAAVLLARAGAPERAPRRPRARRGAAGRSRRRSSSRSALAMAGVSLSRQGLAEHFRSSAQRALAERPADALRDADRSLRLDPEAVPSYYVKAAALARFNEPPRPRARAAGGARGAEPHDFVTWALLGDLAVRTGRLPRGARALPPGARAQSARPGAARARPRTRAPLSMPRRLTLRIARACDRASPARAAPASPRSLPAVRPRRRRASSSTPTRRPARSTRSRSTPRGARRLQADGGGAVAADAAPLFGAGIVASAAAAAGDGDSGGASATGGSTGAPAATGGSADDGAASRPRIGRLGAGRGDARGAPRRTPAPLTAASTAP